MSNIDAGVGIIAKEPTALNSMVNHVNFGSQDWYGDQYISLTNNKELAEEWASKSGNDVVSIDLDKVKSNKYDLSTDKGRSTHLMGDSGAKYKDKVKASRWAEMMEELLVDKKIDMDAIVDRFKPKRK